MAGSCLELRCHCCGVIFVGWLLGLSWSWPDVDQQGRGGAASLQDLHKKYSYIRKTRPDGNCFYRAFGFSHLEALLDDSKELQR